jgi:cytochrome bd-type quinol oxidase subunit 2
MKLSLLPKTTIGKWSVGLIVAFFALFALFLGLAISGHEGGDTLFNNLLLTLPIFLAAWCAVISLVLGIISALRERRLSLLGTVAMAVGLVVSFFILGELLFPH